MLATEWNMEDALRVREEYGIQRGRQEGGNTEEYTGNPFTGSVSSVNTGPMGKVAIRYFTVKSDGRPVIWTVEGGSDGGGTVITPFNKFTVRLAIGKNENSMLLLVKAISAETSEVLGTATVKVKVWRELTAGLKGLISNRSSGWKAFVVTANNGGASFGIRALAYGEGVGTGKGRRIVGGGSDYHPDVLPSISGYNYPVMAYSGDDGQTWTEIHATPALLYVSFIGYFVILISISLSLQLCQNVTGCFVRSIPLVITRKSPPPPKYVTSRTPMKTPSAVFE
jgi:hypothetical protein